MPLTRSPTPGDLRELAEASDARTIHELLGGSKIEGRMDGGVEKRPSTSRQARATPDLPRDNHHTASLFCLRDCGYMDTLLLRASWMHRTAHADKSCLAPCLQPRREGG
jgi:hypothetical protein